MSTSRIRFQQGQFLPAGDLVDDRAYESRLRGLHTRVVHGTWGISLGLDVSAGEGRIVVLPGLAHDCHGRELVLSQPMEVRLPPAVTSGHQRVLCARQAGGPDRPPADIAAVRVGRGVEAGMDPGKDQPAFVWRQRDRIEWGEEVPLAVVESADGVVSLDTSVRPYVRAAQRPYVGYGSARFAGGRPHHVHFPEGRTVCGWQFAVDTTEAGFTGEPDYFVAVADGWAKETGSEHLLGTMTAVVDPSSTGFTLQLTGVFAWTGSIPHAAPEVTWIGLEDLRGCPPPPLLQGWVVAPAGFLFINLIDAGVIVQ